MGWKFRLGLCMLIVSISSVGAAPVKFEGKCSATCSDAIGDYKYSKGKSYNYKFSNNVKMQADHRVIRVELTADVKVAAHGTCEFSLHLSNVKMSQVVKTDKEATRQLTGMPTLLMKSPARFGMDNGKVTGFCPDKDDSDAVANVKRAIISQFQVTSTEHDVNTVEQDVSGECQVYYDIAKADDSVKIKKTRAISGCTKKNRVITKLKGDANDYPTIFGQTPILKGKHECNLVVDKDGHLITSECTEYHTVRAYNAKTEAIRTEITQTLKHTDMEASVPELKITPVMSSLIFQHAQTTHADSKDPLDAGKAVLNDICKSGLNIATQAKQFKIFVRALRSLATSAELVAFAKDLEEGKLCNNVTTKDDVTAFFHDALPYVRTEAAVLLMFEELDGDHLTEAEQKKWMFALTTIKPTVTIIEKVKPLLTKNDKFYLYISSMINHYCQLNPGCNTSKPVTDLIDIILGKLGTECSHPEDNKDAIIAIATALRAVGNLGASNYQRIWRILAKCSQNPAVFSGITVSALQAYRRLPCQADMLDNFVVFENMNLNSEFRVNAFQNLIRCHAIPGVVSRISSQLIKEESIQVGSYVWSRIASHIYGNELGDKLIGMAFMKYIPNIRDMEKKYTREMYKYSGYREKQMTLSTIRSVGTIESSLIYSPDSFVPRQAAVNFTLDMMGYKVNLFDFGLRLEDVEEEVMKFKDSFKTGGMGNMADSHNQWKTSSKKAYDMSKVTKQTPKRSAMGPRFSVYGRVFGDEVFFKAGPLSQLYDLPSCTQDYNITMKKNAMLSDVIISIPTISGFPVTLQIEAVLSTGSTFVKKWQTDVTLVMKPKVAMFVSGKMSIVTPDASMTTMFEVSAYSKFGSTVKMDVVDQQLVTTLTPEDPTREYLNMETKVDVVTDQDELTKIFGTPSPVKMVTIDKCWSDRIYKIYGGKFCISSSLPEVKTPSQVMEPWINTFFRGPTRIRLYWDGDKDIKTYVHRASFSEGFFGIFSDKPLKLEFFYDTPGTKEVRKFQILYTRSRSTGQPNSKLERKFVMSSPWRSLELMLNVSRKEGFDYMIDAGGKFDGQMSGTKLDFTMNGEFVQKDRVGKLTWTLKSARFGDMLTGTYNQKAVGNKFTSGVEMNADVNKYKSKYNLDFISTNSGDDIDIKVSSKHETKDPAGKVIHAHSAESGFKAQIPQDNTYKFTTTHCQSYSTATPEYKALLNIDCKAPAQVMFYKSKTGVEILASVPGETPGIETSRLYGYLKRDVTDTMRSTTGRFTLPKIEMDSGFRSTFTDRKHFSSESYLVTSAGKNHSATARVMFDDFFNNDIEIAITTCSKQRIAYSIRSTTTFLPMFNMKKVATVEYYDKKTVATVNLVETKVDASSIYSLDTMVVRNDKPLGSTSLVATVSDKVKAATLEIFDGSKVKQLVLEFGYGFSRLPEIMAKLNLGIMVPALQWNDKFLLDFGLIPDSNVGYLKTTVKYSISNKLLVAKNRGFDHKTEWKRMEKSKKYSSYVLVEYSPGQSDEKVGFDFKWTATSDLQQDNRWQTDSVATLKKKPDDKVLVKNTLQCFRDYNTGVRITCKGIKTEYFVTNQAESTLTDLSLVWLNDKRTLNLSMTDSNLLSMSSAFTLDLGTPYAAKMALTVTGSSKSVYKKIFANADANMASLDNLLLALDAGIDDSQGVLKVSRVASGGVSTYTEEMNIKIYGSNTFDTKNTLIISDKQYDISQVLNFQGKQLTTKAIVPKSLDEVAQEVSVEINNPFLIPVHHIFVYSASKKNLKYFLKFTPPSDTKSISIQLDKEGDIWVAGIGKAAFKVNYFDARILSLAFEKSGDYSDKYQAKASIDVQMDGKKVSAGSINIANKKLTYELTYDGKTFNGDGNYVVDAKGLNGIITVKEQTTIIGSVNLKIEFQKSYEMKTSFDKYFTHELLISKADNTQTIGLLNFKVNAKMDQKLPKVQSGNFTFKVNSQVKDAKRKSIVFGEFNVAPSDGLKKHMKMDFECDGTIKKQEWTFNGQIDDKKVKAEHEHDIQELGPEVFTKPGIFIDSTKIELPSGDEYELTVKYLPKETFKFVLQAAKHFQLKNVLPLSQSTSETTPFEFEIEVSDRELEVESMLVNQLIFGEIYDKPTVTKLKGNLFLGGDPSELTITKQSTKSGATNRTFIINFKRGPKTVTGTIAVGLTHNYNEKRFAKYLSIDLSSNYDVTKLTVLLDEQWTSNSCKHKSELSYSKSGKDYDLWSFAGSSNRTGTLIDFDLMLEYPVSAQLAGKFDLFKPWVNVTGSYEMKRQMAIDCGGSQGIYSSFCRFMYKNDVRKVVLAKHLTTDGTRITKVAWDYDKKQLVQITRQYNVDSSGKYMLLEVLNPIRTLRYEANKRYGCIEKGTASWGSISMPTEAYPQYFKINSTLTCQQSGDNKRYDVIVESSLFVNNIKLNVSMTKRDVPGEKFCSVTVNALLDAKTQKYIMDGSSHTRDFGNGTTVVIRSLANSKNWAWTHTSTWHQTSTSYEWIHNDRSNSYNGAARFLWVPGKMEASNSWGSKFVLLRNKNKVDFYVKNMDIYEIFASSDRHFIFYDCFFKFKSLLTKLSVTLKNSNVRDLYSRAMRLYYTDGTSSQDMVVATQEFNRTTFVIKGQLRWDRDAISKFQTAAQATRQATRDRWYKVKEKGEQLGSEIRDSFKAAFNDYLNTNNVVKEFGDIKESLNQFDNYRKNARRSNAFYMNKVLGDPTAKHRSVRSVSEMATSRLTNTWTAIRDFFSELAALRQRRIDRVRKIIGAWWDQKMEDMKLLDTIFTPELIAKYRDAMSHSYLKYMKKIVSEDFKEIREQLLTIVAQIMGKEQELKDYLEFKKAVLSGEYLRAYQIFVKPELFKYDATKPNTVSMQMYSNPLMRYMYRRRAGTDLSTIQFTGLRRVALLLRIRKRIRAFIKSRDLNRLVPPYDSYAHVILDEHIIQYEGQAVFNATIGTGCTKVFAHDAKNQQFSVIALKSRNRRSFMIQATTAKADKTVHILVDDLNKVYVEGTNSQLTPTETISVSTPAGGSLTFNRYVSDVFNYANNIIATSPNLLEIRMCPSFGGLTVTCFKDACTFKVPGRHFNNIIGLLGSNNYDGKLYAKTGKPFTTAELADKRAQIASWTLEDCDTRTKDPLNEYMSPDFCRNSINSWFRRGFCDLSVAQLNVTNFEDMCDNNPTDTCGFAASYVLACGYRGAYTKVPYFCRYVVSQDSIDTMLEKDM